MYILYANASNSLLSYTHVGVYVVWRVHLRDRNIAGYIATLISVHIPCWNSSQPTRCVEHSTKSMILLYATFMTQWTCNEKKSHPPLLHFWWRIERKMHPKRGRSSFEFEKLWKKTTLCVLSSLSSSSWATLTNGSTMNSLMLQRDLNNLSKKPWHWQ